MKFRNDTDRDLYLFGENFSHGATVDYTGTDPDKLAYLRRNLTEVVATETKTAPPEPERPAFVEPDPVESVDVPDPVVTTRKKKVRRRRRSE